jgi:hypothetical protein
MSINGVSATTLGPNGDRAGSGDGIDDSGVASGSGASPEELPQEQTFGVAMVFRDSNPGSTTTFFSSLSGSGSIFELVDTSFIDSSTGELRLVVRDDNKNTLAVETTAKFVDGNVHLLVIGKNGNAGSDLSLYIDDMTTPVNVTIQRDQAFDNTNYSNSTGMGFFARNTTSGVDRFNDCSFTFLEFNQQPYNATQRQNLKQRAPGL